MARGMIGGDFATVAPFVAAAGLLPRERLGVYRHTMLSTLTAAIELNFPAVRALVGEAFFAMAAARYAAAAPPAAATPHAYGDGFAAFLQTLPEAAELPYLAAIPAARHDALCFAPHASVRLLTLTAPADRIADAVLAGDDAAMAAIDLASGPALLLVHRAAQGVRSLRLAPEAFDFLRRMFAGEPWLGLAVQPHAAQNLAEALLSGWLGGVTSTPTRDT